MIVYRIVSAKYDKDLTGEGARLNGGRWNHKGTPCIYTSESRALALAEYTVNVSIYDIPRALSIVRVDIPDSEIKTIAVKDLPGDWREMPCPSSTRDFGTGLLLSAKVLIIKIPSVILPEEYNYLLNPAHPHANEFTLLDITDFIYDIRLKTI